MKPGKKNAAKQGKPTKKKSEKTILKENIKEAVKETAGAVKEIKKRGAAENGAESRGAVKIPENLQAEQDRSPFALRRDLTRRSGVFGRYQDHLPRRHQRDRQEPDGF